MKSIASTKMKLKIEFGKMAVLEDALKIETIIREEILKNLSFAKLQECVWIESFVKEIKGTRVSFVW